MSPKRWSLLTLLLLFISVFGIIFSVMLIDPFEIYHQATAFIPPISNGSQMYSNAGIAKSYEYDSIIIGTSMTENFTPSQFDALFGGRFVKLPVNAGSPYNLAQMMRMAFNTHDVQRVIYGVDVELMSYFYTASKCEEPRYLYDDDLFNDVSYWFNHSVLLEYLPACLRTLGQHDPNLRDTMYTWGDLYPYGREVVLSQLSITGTVVAQEAPQAEPVLSQQAMLNFEHNILPFITEHPDTQFIFFFPPYSLAHWVQFYNRGAMQGQMNEKEALIAALLAYDNVQVYDFQAQTDWITNLNNYIDTSHYGPQINAAMAEAMAQNRLRITTIAQTKENNAVIARYVAQVIAAGAWPDTFEPAP